MSASRTTYGISVTIGGAAFVAVQDVQPPTLESLDPIDDSRHGDADGISRFIASGRFLWSDCVIEADDILSDPGIAAAIAGVGKASVSVVVTYPASGGSVTFQGLVKSVVPGKQPLSGKRQVSVTIKPSPDRTS